MIGPERTRWVFPDHIREALKEWTADHVATETYARDSEGDPCDPRSTRACCWCAMGIVARIAGVHGDRVLRQYREDTGHPDERVTDPNDAGDHERARQLLTEWAELLEGA